jgi:hypothetical protein
LTFEVARLFGWNRRGPDIAAALDRHGVFHKRHLAGS